MEFSRENKGVLKVTRKSKADLGEKKNASFYFFLKTKYVLEQHQSSSLPLIF